MNPIRTGAALASVVIVSVLSAACRILPTPPPVTPPGTEPIPERPGELSVEDVRTWRFGDRIAASFALRGPASYIVGEGTFRRSSTYNAWLGTCRVSAIRAACRIEPRGDDVATSTMGLALTVGGRGLVGTWFDDAGTLDLVESAKGISIRDGDRVLAEVSLDQRPPAGWIDGKVGRIQRARIAPLILALAALPDPRALEPKPNAPIIATTTRAISREELRRFTMEEFPALRPGPPQPAWGPDTRFSRPIFFVIELVGLGGSFPIGAPRADEGAQPSLSGRVGYSIYGGLDYADFFQLLAGVESRSIAFDNEELEKVSPPGAWDVHGHLRVALAGRLTFFRAGPFGTSIGLERVWLLTDTDSIFFQSADVNTIANTGYVVTARFTGSGWAPTLQLKYKLGPVLHGGDWWSGVSADIILEGRYELITWDSPKIVFTTLGDDPLAAERGLETAERWLAQYPEGATWSSRHGGVRLAFQVRF